MDRVSWYGLKKISWQDIEELFNFLPILEMELKAMPALITKCQNCGAADAVCKVESVEQGINYQVCFSCAMILQFSSIQGALRGLVSELSRLKLIQSEAGAALQSTICDQVICWLGEHRDQLSTFAVASLQKICGVPGADKKGG
jgi:hypothetical protein